jgi:hypothetical protein
MPAGKAEEDAVGAAFAALGDARVGHGASTEGAARRRTSSAPA